MHRILLLSTLSSTLALAPPVAAQDCTQVPGNLVDNCGFDTEIPPWVDLFGTATHDSSEGFAKAGAASLSGGSTGNGHEIQLRQCITPVVEGVTYRFGAAVLGGDVPPDSCQLKASTRSETDCGGGGSFQEETLAPVPASWTAFAETELTPSLEGTVAVQLAVVCIRAAGNFEAAFDDAYFGEVPLFADGFESGDALAWDSVTP